ncbi:hypothetical protein [Flavobacterium sp.]|uniref:hypothetical protein n=1 Tax=Flavobacterium sp. TaxID=239 RepID=UPI00286B2821|nr:hypothetical protein [Flavobacterium sp.]
MKFDKNKDDIKNINILKSEIKKINSPYSKILIDSLFNSSSSEEFRNSIKENVSKHIEDKIKK